MLNGKVTRTRAWPQGQGWLAANCGGPGKWCDCQLWGGWAELGVSEVVRPCLSPTSRYTLVFCWRGLLAEGCVLCKGKRAWGPGNGISKVMIPVDPKTTAWSRPRDHPGIFQGSRSVIGKSHRGHSTPLFSIQVPILGAVPCPPKPSLTLSTRHRSGGQLESADAWHLWAPCFRGNSEKLNHFPAPRCF